VFVDSGLLQFGVGPAMSHDLQDDLEVVGASDDYGFEFDDDAGGEGFQTSGGASRSRMV
jgi:hypothetical protein